MPSAGCSRRGAHASPRCRRIAPPWPTSSGRSAAEVTSAAHPKGGAMLNPVSKAALSTVAFAVLQACAQMPAQAPAQGAAQGPEVTLTRLDCGTGPNDPRRFSDTFAYTESTKPFTFSCYVIK